MRLNLKQTLSCAVVFLGGLVGSSAMAQPRPNVVDGGTRWTITAYDDTSAGHVQMATQTLCFLPYGPAGTHIQGIWYSTSFPNWRGRYSQEGDRVLMHGDYANDVGHDGMVIELSFGTTPRDVGAGQWTEWRETGLNGTSIAFANTRLQRVGTCRPPFTVANLPLEVLEKQVKELVLRVPPRMRTDGKVSESPIDPDQIPVKEAEDADQ